jgi:hypothetical protein
MSKAVARIAGRPRQKEPLPSLKVKWNTNVRPSTQDVVIPTSTSRGAKLRGETKVC